MELLILRFIAIKQQKRIDEKGKIGNHADIESTVLFEYAFRLPQNNLKNTDPYYYYTSLYDMRAYCSVWVM